MRTLLVRLSSMGDLIHTLPAITDLAQYRPHIKLDWLCEAAFADIARLHPFIHQVHEMQWRTWRKHLWQTQTWHAIHTLKHHLQQTHYQQVLDSQGLLKSALFARFAHAPILGLDKHSAREPLATYFYTHCFDVCKGEDAVWRNRQLFAKAFDYAMPNSPPDFAIATQARLDFTPLQYRVALHATSRDSKLWLKEHWINLLRQLHQKDGLPILLPWGNATEQQRAHAIAQTLPFVQVCPPLSLRQATQLLSHAHSVVGVDTGLLHLANACNRPTVGIYTHSDPYKVGLQISPWTKNVGGIDQIPHVAEVFASITTCEIAFYNR